MTPDPNAPVEPTPVSAPAGHQVATRSTPPPGLVLVQREPRASRRCRGATGRRRRFSPIPTEAQALTPRLSHVAGIADAYGRHLLAATVGTQVSPAFALAVIAVESSGRREAVSHAGAQGLMQLIPATAERFGVDDPFDPAQNIRGGVAYLDWLMEEFDRDPVLVLAAYNAGEGAVRRSGRRSGLRPRDAQLRAARPCRLAGRAHALPHAARPRVRWLRVSAHRRQLGIRRRRPPIRDDAAPVRARRGRAA
jgi:hypothetical protein